MTINPREILGAYRTLFPMFATKVFNTINPGRQFIASAAFMAMTHALTELEAGRINRLLITVPPRSGKSMP